MNWLRDNGEEVNEPLPKVELLKILKTKKQPKRYVIDKMAAERGRTVLRIPPYHCQYNAIELSYEEQYSSFFRHKKKMNLLENWASVVEKTKKVIMSDWDRDVAFDNLYIHELSPEEVLQAELGSEWKTEVRLKLRVRAKVRTMIEREITLCRGNIFPDNLVQAAFQQAHTTYVRAPLLLVNNITENGTTEALIRVISYRSGTNTLGLVFFCLVFGSILGTVGSKGRVVVDFFQVIFEVIMKMVSGVMWVTPLGVASVIAGKILEVSNVAQVIAQLGWFIATVAAGVFFYQLIIMQLLYFIFLRKNPYKFYWGLTQAMVTASATASTAAALPVTFRCMEGDLRIDPRITRFVLPVGCNINMDGTALFLAVSSVFICQMNGIQLGFGEFCTIFLTSTAASLSSASVPSAALVLLLVVLASVDAPSDDVSLLFAVDCDRIRTTNNMLGDCYAAAVVEYLSKKELMACDSATPHVFLGLRMYSDVMQHATRRLFVGTHATNEDSMTSNEHLTTPITERHAEISTPEEKALVSSQVVIDMHLNADDSTERNT
ncbi:hypothetical protein EVAR_67304_1 [Eumeta japonica]|uniref:Amino acid transporter n=1 Tax=Eumeta variegata TaxID=151549 RepID=A0A4C1ZDS4_EUMVA|nr:hypothetical protein EVAR_67304_1 [Eumeta japonica]